MSPPILIDFAKNGQKVEPSSELQELGFTPQNDYVLGENMNFILNNVFANLKYLTSVTSSVTKIITENYSASAGESLWVDTNAQIVEITLPTPTANATVFIGDLKSNFATNKVVILRNGATIMGFEKDMNVDKNNISFMLECVEISENNYDWRVR